MKIVHPYGSSRSQSDAKASRRVLIDNTRERRPHPIPRFAGVHDLAAAAEGANDELVIAQWISIVDKIARKPSGRNKPTREQRDLREKLGNACWVRMTCGNHLPGLDKRREHLNKLWWFKIHPYGPGTEEPRRRKDGSLPASAEAKGRWYEVFAGDSARDPADARTLAEIVAERIERHLYVQKYRLGPDSRPKEMGLIAARAYSIEGNVLRVPEGSDTGDDRPTWSDEDINVYTQPGDPVRAIRAAAEALEAQKGRLRLSDAAKMLFEHWPKVFRNAEGKVLDVPGARQQYPGMFALHDQLKQCYRRLLKRARKDTPEHRRDAAARKREERKLSTLLPRDLKAALRLSDMQTRNAELAALVRLGKVIHYTAAQGIADQTRAVIDNWPDDVEASRFWQSDGQAEIKRAEAFVRIWRQALVLANLTLRDWADYRGDILGTEGQKQEALANATAALRSSDPARRDRFDRKLVLLFGNRATVLGLATDEDRIALLRALIDGAANLRHASFHFKGRGELLVELEKLPDNFSEPVKAAAGALWQADVKDRTARLKAVLVGAHADKYLTQKQAEQVFALLHANAAELPLPRFARVLERRKNAWDEDKGIRLPEPPNRRKLEEQKARLCLYTLLTLVYERPFRTWLTEQQTAAIARWRDRAVNRASAAAKAQNAKDDEIARQVIAARAADLPVLPEGGDIRHFFFDLSAATASEMRVQRGYASDAENARNQAGFIDDLLCDVMILAFSAYLEEKALGWLLDIRPDQPPSESPTCSLKALPEPKPDLAPQRWQTALYLILHVLPVESVGQLLHQLRRWGIAAGRDSRLREDERARLDRLFAAMTLYLDMHDAKFEGGDALAGCGPLCELFASKEDGFRRVFRDPEPGAQLDRRVPHRGLREIMRFGHLPVLNAIRGGKTIDDKTIDRVLAMEAAPDDGRSPIAKLQQRREDLHEAWVQSKEPDAARPFGQSELEDYCKTLADVVRHRAESNVVYLVDHVRAHRTVMAVLGRLVDYAGLFERDLYFVTLALLHRHGLRPDDLSTSTGVNHLGKGRIISALYQHKKDDTALAVLRDLAAHFTKVWESGNPKVRIRNDLMHFNMLQKAPPAPHLTHWVNQARQLMDYDRKLKNAVSKSVIELLAREGIVLRWDINATAASHDLVNADLSSRCAVHLGGQALRRKGADRRDKGAPIAERLHGENYVVMIANAFEGTAKETTTILDDLLQVDWAASVAPRGRPKEVGAQRPPSDRQRARRGNHDSRRNLASN